MSLAVTSEWVETVFASLSLEEKVGHLLCPEDRGKTPQDWVELLKEVPLGCVFFEERGMGAVRASAEAIQAQSRVPVVVAADMEAGLACGTLFPHAMGCGAAGDSALVREKGRIGAREARALGIHWTFSPVVDLALNPNNPETQYRAFGDNASEVTRLVLAFIEGLQEHGALAGTAKHFPGAGLDDRDQHLCTSINPLAMAEWRASYGKVWKAVVDAGVMSIMAGHISLPDYEGLSSSPAAALPATLNRRLQVDLLRSELGFKGVLVSDAAPMIGLASRSKHADVAVQNILAGSDVFLFSDPRTDFKALLKAVKEGRLPLERVDESVRRVLALKERLGIHRDPFGPALNAADWQAHQASAQALADKAVTVHRIDAVLAAKLKPGAKILTVTVENQAKLPELDVIDRELRARGFQVEHLNNPGHNVLLKRAPEFDRVFVNIAQEIHQPIGSPRLTGPAIMNFWRAFWRESENAVFTSFGSPYHFYELPHLPNMVMAWGKCEAAQIAAVKVWLGESTATGRCPVRLPGGI